MSTAKVLAMEARVLASLKNGGLSRGEIIAACESTRKSVEWALHNVVARGQVVSSGGGKKRRYGLSLEAANAACLALGGPKKRQRDPGRGKKNPGIVSCAAAIERVYDLTPPRSHIEIELGTGRARLPILRADEVTTENQLFHCPRFVADLSAGACMGRQLLATDSVTWADRRKIGGRNGPASPVTYRRCMGCAIGETVAARVAKGRAA